MTEDLCPGMQHYMYMNDVLLLGFSPEISSIFIEVLPSPGGTRIVLNPTLFIDTAHNQEPETKYMWGFVLY